MRGAELGRVTVLGFWAHSYAGPTSSFMITHDGGKLLLDTGVDPIGRLAALKEDPTQINAVFVSHLHSDHASGLSNFIFTRQLLGRSDPHLPQLQIFAIPAVLVDVEKLVRLQYPDRMFNIKLTELHPKQPVRMASLVLESINNVHSVPAAGIRVQSSDWSVGYTSDSAPFAEQADLFAGVNVLIGECFGSTSDVGQVAERGHSNSTDLSRLISGCAPDWVIPFHFDQRYLSEVHRDSMLEELARKNTRLVDPVVSRHVDLNSAGAQ